MPYEGECPCLFRVVIPATVSRMLSLIPIAFMISTITTPYENGTIGFRIDLPSNSSVIATSAMPPSCLITGGKSSNTWHLRLDRGANPAGLTPQKLVHELKNQHEDPSGTQILQDQAVTLGGVDGWLLLIEQESQAGDASLFGWLVLPVVGDQYMLASVLTTESAWEVRRKEINDTLNSIRLLDPVELITRKLVWPTSHMKTNGIACIRSENIYLICLKITRMTLLSLTPQTLLTGYRLL